MKIADQIVFFSYPTPGMRTEIDEGLGLTYKSYYHAHGFPDYKGRILRDATNVTPPELIFCHYKRVEFLSRLTQYEDEFSYLKTVPTLVLAPTDTGTKNGQLNYYKAISGMNIIGVLGLTVQWYPDILRGLVEDFYKAKSQGDLTPETFAQAREAAHRGDRKTILDVLRGTSPLIDPTP